MSYMLVKNCAQKTCSEPMVEMCVGHEMAADDAVKKFTRERRQGDGTVIFR